MFKKVELGLSYLINTDFENEMFSVVVNDVPYEDLPFMSSAQTALIAPEI